MGGGEGVLRGRRDPAAVAHGVAVAAGPGPDGGGLLPVGDGSAGGCAGAGAGEGYGPTPGAAGVGDPGGEVVSQRGGVGREPPRWQVLEAGGLELGDGLLDDGVAAVVGFDIGQRQVPVGDERVVVPVGEQGELASGVGRTRRTTRRTCRAWRGAPANTVNGVSAMSTPETSGVDSQYGIGVQAASSIAVIAVIAGRTRLSCRAVMENRTSSFAAVPSTALE